MRSKSIIVRGNNLECWVCGRIDRLELHHCVHGTANRALSDADGLTVFLCPEHHRGNSGVHGKNGRELDLTLKRMAQAAWEARYGDREAFRKRYGKSYL